MYYDCCFIVSLVLASTDKKDFISHLGGLKAPSKTVSVSFCMIVLASL